MIISYRSYLILMKNYFKYPVVNAGLSFLSKKEKNVLIAIAVVITLGGLIETIAFGSIFPLITFILEPSKIEDNKYFIALFNFLGKPSEFQFTLYLTLASLFLLILASILNLVVTFFSLKFSSSCWRRLSSDLMMESLNTPYEWFLNKNSSKNTRLFYHDIPLWSRDFVGLILSLFSDLIVFVFLGLLVVFLFPIQGIMAVVLVAFLGFFLLLICKPQIKKYSSIQRVTADTSNLSINQIFLGIKDIKISSKETFFLSAFNRTINDATNASLWLKFWGKVYPTAFLFIIQSGLVFITIFLWMTGFSGTEIATYLALALMISSRIVPSINRIIGNAGALLNVEPFIYGIKNYRDTLHETKELNLSKQENNLKNKKTKLTGNWKNIDFERVTFYYEKTKTPALKNISFTLKKNKIYGLVGYSGSGKSTLIDLLLGLLYLDKGNIFIDGKSINTFDKSVWIRQVGYVPQSPFLIDGNLKENIIFSQKISSGSENFLETCIDDAQLRDFIKELPLGLNTNVGERGSKISGGQKQRIAIARALFKKPSLLILDEATNALDHKNEQDIFRVLNRLKNKTTIIIITHNLTNLKNVDNILLLNKGRLINSGTFDFVYSNSKTFRGLLKE